MNILKIVCFCFLPVILAEKGDLNVKYLESGDNANYNPQSNRLGFIQPELKIFCYRGHSKELSKLFYTVFMQLDIESDDFNQYEGTTPEDVKNNYNDQRSLFNVNLFSYKRTRIKLDPFNQTCIGIETVHPYKINVLLKRVDLYNVILLILGISTFWYAAKLSNNSLFYYITGILIGIFASFLVLIYFLSKLFPKRPLMYGVLIGGSTIAIYLFQVLLENIQMIIFTYHSFVIWYILITGFVSFVICYRIGPPKNERSKDLIKWGLQIISCFLINSSSQFQEANIAIIFILLIGFYFPKRVLNKARMFYIRKFPQTPRLLSIEEYYEQGTKETSQALENLRKYCNSPECKQWKIVTKIKDPIKFASFIEGSSHLLEEEIVLYENSRLDMSDSEMSEDEENDYIPQSVHKLDEDISEDEDDDENENDEIQINLRKGNSSRIHKTSTPRNGMVMKKKQETYPNSRLSGKKIIYKSFDREYSDED